MSDAADRSMFWHDQFLMVLDAPLPAGAKSVLLALVRDVNRFDVSRVSMDDLKRWSSLERRAIQGWLRWLSGQPVKGRSMPPPPPVPLVEDTGRRSGHGIVTRRLHFDALVRYRRGGASDAANCADTTTPSASDAGGSA